MPGMELRVPYRFRLIFFFFFFFRTLLDMHQLLLGPSVVAQGFVPGRPRFTVLDIYRTLFSAPSQLAAGVRGVFCEVATVVSRAVHQKEALRPVAGGELNPSCAPGYRRRRSPNRPLASWTTAWLQFSEEKLPFLLFFHVTTVTHPWNDSHVCVALCVPSLPCFSISPR